MPLLIALVGRTSLLPKLKQMGNRCLFEWHHKQDYIWLVYRDLWKVFFPEKCLWKKSNDQR